MISTNIYVTKKNTDNERALLGTYKCVIYVTSHGYCSTGKEKLLNAKLCAEKYKISQEQNIKAGNSTRGE